MNKEEPRKEKQRTRPIEENDQHEEAATVLKLGEFQNVPALSNSEALILINTVKNKRAQQGKPVKQTAVLTGVEDYLDIFARFKRRENVDAVERLLSTTSLQRYERSQLASLCCHEADEAKTLIPSLVNKMTDEELDHILEQINKLQQSE